MASLAATAASNALSLDGFGIKWGGWNYPAWRKVQVRRRSCCTFSCDAIDLMIWISPARSCRESVLELMHRLGGELHTDVFTVVNLLITLGVLPRPPPRGTISSPGGVQSAGAGGWGCPGSRCRQRAWGRTLRGAAPGITCPRCACPWSWTCRCAPRPRRTRRSAAAAPRREPGGRVVRHL